MYIGGATYIIHKGCNNRPSVYSLEEAAIGSVAAKGDG